MQNTYNILAPTKVNDELSGFVVMAQITKKTYKQIKKYLAPIIYNNKLIGYLSKLNHQPILDKYFERTIIGNMICYKMKDK